ncbi:hypothetical protein MD484_g4736, partial [Candolleomyces efflorescens]
MSALTDLSLAFPAPFKVANLLFLNTIPHLRTLSLSIDPDINDVLWPKPGEQLLKTHQEQRKSKITSLTVEGDSFFVFHSASLFCGPSLHSFAGKVSMSIVPELTTGLLLAPHVLHLVMAHNPKVHKFSIEWKGESCIDDHEAWGMESERGVFLDSFYPTLSKLRNITTLSFKNAPVTDRNFVPQVLATLPALASLRTLALVPLRVSGRNNYPTTAGLATICAKFSSLEHLTIILDDLPEVPEDLPQMTHPGHGLKTLLMVPGPSNELDHVSISDIIALATYLDRLFPRLCHVKLHVYDDDGYDLHILANLEPLVKSFQKIRRDAVQFGRNA